MEHAEGERGQPEGQGTQALPVPGAETAVESNNDLVANWRRLRYHLESMAIHGEDPAELRALYDRWYNAYQPESPAECHLIDMAVHDLIQLRRCRRLLKWVESDLVKGAEQEWLREQEREVAKYRAKLATAPAAAAAAAAAALVQLLSFTQGCAWLIDCWKNLDLLMEKERAARDGSRHPATGPGSGEALGPPESDYLTRVYCLLARDHPEQRAIHEFYRAVSLYPQRVAPCDAGRLPARPECRRLVRAVIDRELPALRRLHERLQTDNDKPAQEILLNQMLLRDPRRNQLLRSQRQCERLFQKNYAMLQEFRPGFSAAAFTPDLPGRSGLAKPTSRRRSRSARAAD